MEKLNLRQEVQPIRITNELEVEEKHQTTNVFSSDADTD